MRRTRDTPIPTFALLLPLALSLLLAVPALRAADPPKASAMQEGIEALQLNDWPGAAKVFQSIVDREPGNGEAWFRLGIAQREMGQYDPATKSFDNALARGYAPPMVTTSLAIVAVARKDYDKAFAYLDRAVKLGVPAAVLESHPGLVAVHDDPRFKRLLAAAAQAGHPCESDPRYRAFDFWLGEWDVYAGGQRVGNNHIDQVAHGCALLENWTGAGGGGGKSLNYLDPSDGKWRQNWVGDGGEVILYQGGLQDGAMRMTGETRLPNGKTQLARGAWTPRPDGAVRQLLETSTDGGKTWKVAFDGVYVKKGSAPPAAH